MSHPRSLLLGLQLTVVIVTSAQDGKVDLTFDPGAGPDGNVVCMALQPDGKILIGGEFDHVGAVTRNGLARLNEDGSLDETFDPAAINSGWIYSILSLPDGKVMIGGSFSTMSTFGGIARLNNDGTLDPSFNPGTGTNAVNCMARQSDGKVVIGGNFTSYNGTTRGRVARVNTDGSLDTGFDPGSGANSYVEAICVRPSGKILVGGDFTTFNGTSCGHMVRLTTTGTLDPFNIGTGFGNVVSCIINGQWNSIIVGGAFGTYNGQALGGVVVMDDSGLANNTPQGGSQWVKVAQMADGRVVYNNGYQGSCPRRVTWPFLQPDAAMSPSTGAYNIRDMVLQPDGRVLLCGLFTQYAGVPRSYIVRVNGPSVKLMLEGPLATDGASMNDALRTLPSFPLTEPFSTMGYSTPGFDAGGTIAPAVLARTGSQAIVDWIVLELRSTSTPGTIAAAKAFLLQRDGFVVNTSGQRTLTFPSAAYGNYCLAARTRNHLPVMTRTTAPIYYGSTGPSFDFSSSSTSVYDADSRKFATNQYLLAAGDVGFDGSIKYTGSGNDRDPLLTRVGSTTPNATAAGYWREDVNMDGVVKYTGSANDRDIILTNVGSTTPNNTRVATLP